jgi:hypothetical protein
MVNSLAEIASSLKEVRLKGFAGGGEFEKLESGFKRFRDNSKEGLYYEDRYIELLTPETFAGEEIFLVLDRLAWYMVYSGGMLPEYAADSDFVTSVMDFLKECLVIGLEAEKDPETDFWPRGPLGLRKPDHIIVNRKPSILLYRCSVMGHGIRRFSGREMIKITEEEGFIEKDVFVCTFFGGSPRP